ncbi:zinc finger protein 84 [Trichonephila clavipes]|nr:zinc finger protein 84 [Trichonephila clavipes]
MEHQTIDASALDPYSPWQDDFDFEQSNLQSNAVDPKNISTELKQQTTDEILVRESAPVSIIETTSYLNLGTVPWNRNYNLENSDGQLGLLSFSKFHLCDSKGKISLPKETSLDAISGREIETKCENVESEFENIAILGSSPRNTVSKSSPTKEDSFIEAQGNGSSALDDFLDKFQADKSNLHFRFTDPNSGSVEFKQNTADESKLKQLIPNFSVDGSIFSQSYINSEIFLEKYNISTNENNSNYERKFHCPICFKQFNSETAAQKCIHSNGENFQEDIQEGNVSQKGHLSEIKPIHSKTFPCSVCEQKFNDKSRLNRHMLNHIEEKPFQCHLCEKKFSQRRFLVDHMRSHTGEKPFLYHVSGERFSRQRTLTNHLQRHTGKKAFQCDVYEKMFSLKGNCNVHMRVHTGEKPFQCFLYKTPKHSKCPTGSTSWCFYQRALVKNENPMSHSLMKTKLSEQVLEKILPVYQRLVNDELLERYSSAEKLRMPTTASIVLFGKTAQKETFVSKKRLEMGVISAIGGYNFGCFNSLAIEHNELSSVSVDISHKRDKNDV